MADRRGKGEGGISHLKNGQWQASYQDDPLGDPKHRKARRFRLKKDAAAWLVKAIADRDKGLALLDEKQTIKDFMVTYLEQVAKNSVKPQTLANYRGWNKNHITPHLGRRLVSQLTPEQVQRWVNLLGKTFKPHYVATIHGMFSGAMKQAVLWRLATANPATNITLPRVPKEVKAVLLPEEQDRFLEALKGDRLEAFFVMALRTGLRRGELGALLWVNVDLDNALVRVEKNMTRYEGTWHHDEPKSDAGFRTVTLSPQVVAALRWHREHQQVERAVAGRLWREHGLVFTTTRGGHIIGRYTTDYLRKALDRAGLPYRRFHVATRHTHGADLAAEDVTIDTSMERLGHSTPKMSLHYRQMTPKLQRRDAEKINRIGS